MEKFQERQRNFQKAGDPKHNLKRQQFAISLRKQKRMESHQRSRCPKPLTDSSSMNEEYPGPTDSSEDIEIDLEYSLPAPVIPVLEDNAVNTHNHTQLQQLRIAISMTGAPVEQYVTMGVIPFVLPFALEQEESPCKYEALWILCNIASGPSICVKELVKYGGIEILANNLVGTSVDFVENALWGIANVLGDSKDYMLMVLENNYYSKLLHILRQYPLEQIQKVVTWGIRNSCHYHDLINPTNTDLLLEIADTLLMSPSIWVKINAIQCMIILTREDNTKLEALLASNFLLHCLEHFGDEELLVYLFRLLGNICSGTVAQTQKLLDMKILDRLAVFVGHQDSAVVKEVYWVLSNIAAGSLEQVETLEKHPMFLSSVCGILHHDSRVKIEASFYLANYLRIATPLMRKRLFKNQIMDTAVEALEFKAPEFVMNILCIFEIYIKTVGAQRFCKKGYQKKVDDLQTHTNPDVYLKTAHILERLLGIYEECN